MLKTFSKATTGSWFWSWGVLCMLLAVWYSPNITAHRRLMTAPEWINANGIDYRGNEILNTLDSSFNFNPSPQTFGELLTVLKKLMPVQLDASSTNIQLDDPLTEVLVSQHLSLGNYLNLVLEPLDHSISVRNGQLFIQGEATRFGRMTRNYPCPKLEPQALIDLLLVSASKSAWDVDGGEDTINIIDTDVQSILVIACSYATHKELEGLIANLNKRAGIGRVQRSGVGSLYEKILNRIIPPQPSNAPGGMSGGMGGTMGYSASGGMF